MWEDIIYLMQIKIYVLWTNYYSIKLPLSLIRWLIFIPNNTLETPLAKSFTWGLTSSSSSAILNLTAGKLRWVQVEKKSLSCQQSSQLICPWYAHRRFYSYNICERSFASITFSYCCCPVAAHQQFLFLHCHWNYPFSSANLTISPDRNGYISAGCLSC